MANYLRPDVYVEEVLTGEKPITSTSTSVGAFVGVTARGPVGKAIQVTSWTDFVNKFAKGMATPFLRSSYLANAVYGFYQNGGSICYVTRVAVDDSMAKAQLVEGNLTITAKDEGDWANNALEVVIEANKKIPTNFNVIVTFNSVVVETFENVSNNVESPNFFGEIVNKSNYIQIAPDQKLTKLTKKAMAGGAYTLSPVKNSAYTEGLHSLDAIPNVNLIAIPGIFANEVVTGLVDYATEKKAFAIVDAPVDTEANTDTLLAFREKVNGNGAIYFPWGKISDPLSNNGALRDCPPSGHIMGIYARTDANRGVHKDPAGEEAVVRGFVDLTAKVTNAQLELLNPKGVNCIVARPYSGIVVWGARNVGTDASKPYISDIRYDIMVKQSLYDGTQWAVFEPNDHILWDRLGTSLASFLDLQWRNGALLGQTSEQAYYVKCDEELNDEISRNNGILVAEIGYAKKKPAEFVVIRIVQKSN